MLERYVTTYAAELAPLLVAAAAGLFALWRDDRRRAWWLTPWLVLALAAVLLQRQLAGYQFLLAVPPLAITAAAGLHALAARVRAGPRPQRIIAGAVLLAVALLAVRQVGDWRTAYGPGVRHRFGDLSRERYLRSFAVDLPATEERAAAYLRARTQPGDGILVWGLSPGIYALADRHPVTRYPFHKLLMTEAPLSRMIPGLEDRRAELMRRLEADPPAYILVGRNDRNGFEPQDSIEGMLAFAAFFRFVDTRYREETKIGRFVVLRRMR
jgi:hypothetical protein